MAFHVHLPWAMAIVVSAATQFVWLSLFSNAFCLSYHSIDYRRYYQLAEENSFAQCSPSHCFTLCRLGQSHLTPPTPRNCIWLASGLSETRGLACSVLLTLTQPPLSINFLSSKWLVYFSCH